jgi:enamine deaminase RidA (YjgF/YER057c/UK114 family)
MEQTREYAKFGIDGESDFGFVQAVKVGDTIYVSGQTAWQAQGGCDIEAMAAQMSVAYEKITQALASFGASLTHVVDEVLFVTDIPAALACATAIRSNAYSGQPQVASTMIGVASLGAPELLVEIKCVARL